MTGLIEVIPARKFGVPVEIGTFTKGKDSAGNEGVFIEGYASTRDLDRGGDIVEPAAFDKSLSEYMANPLVTYMHDWSNPIGRTVQARTDERGLWVRAFVSKTATTVLELIKEGILKGFSIGYEIVQEEVRQGVNHLLEIKLYEIAVVSIPMNPNTLFNMAKALERGAGVLEIKALFTSELRRAAEEKLIEIVSGPEIEIVDSMIEIER